MMKVLPLAFPGDAAVSAVEDEYLFGNDLLVAPVHTPGTSREIVFPAGPVDQYVVWRSGKR